MKILRDLVELRALVEHPEQRLHRRGGELVALEVDGGHGVLARHELGEDNLRAESFNFQIDNAKYQPTLKYQNATKIPTYIKIVHNFLFF